LAARVVRVVVVRAAGFWTPVGFAVFDARVALPNVPFFASAVSAGSFFATLLTSPRAARLRVPSAPLAGAVVVRLVTAAFWGGLPALLVSRAAALARVRRVVPTGTFSAFSSVTARRVATLA